MLLIPPPCSVTPFPVPSPIQHRLLPYTTTKPAQTVFDAVSPTSPINPNPQNKNNKNKANQASSIKTTVLFLVPSSTTFGRIGTLLTLTGRCTSPRRCEPRLRLTCRATATRTSTFLPLPFPAAVASGSEGGWVPLLLVSVTGLVAGWRLGVMVGVMVGVVTVEERFESGFVVLEGVGSRSAVVVASIAVPIAVDVAVDAPAPAPLSF